MRHLTTLFTLVTCATSMAEGPKTIHFDELAPGQSLSTAYDALGVRFSSHYTYVTTPNALMPYFGGARPRFLCTQGSGQCRITFHVPGSDRMMGATAVRFRFAAYRSAQVSLYTTNGRLIRTYRHPGDRQGIWVDSGTEGPDSRIGSITIRPFSSTSSYAAIDDLTFWPGDRPVKEITGKAHLEDCKSTFEASVLLTIRSLDRPWETLERWVDPYRQFRLFLDIPAGDYEFLARGDTWLQALHPPVRIDNEGSAVLDFRLKNGDVNSDNVVDLGDYAIVAQLMDKETHNLDDPRPDLNQDGWVDRADLEIIQRNFGLVGDE